MGIFMNIRKTSIIVIGAVVFLAIGSTASAEVDTDDQNDVWHWSPPHWVAQAVSQPNIDIKEISAEVTDTQLTLTLTLWPGGEFNRSDKDAAVYWVYYNTSDAMYYMSYSDTVNSGSQGVAFGMNTAGVGGYIPSVGEVQVTDTSLHCTLNLTGNVTVATDFYAFSWLVEDYQQMDYYAGEGWYDWAGDIDAPGEIEDGTNGDGTNGGDDDGTGQKGTPGFELAVLLAAIILAGLVIRRRK